MIAEEREAEAVGFRGSKFMESRGDAVPRDDDVCDKRNDSLTDSSMELEMKKD